VGLWWLVPFGATIIGQGGYRGVASLFPLLIAAFLVRRFWSGTSTLSTRSANLAGPATSRACADARG